MLVVFVALVALVNNILGEAGVLLGYPTLSLQMICSGLFAPMAWLMGIPWSEAFVIGELLGEKLVLNEFKGLFASD